MNVHFLRSVLFLALTVGTLGDDGRVTFVSELSSKPAQKLSRYSWFGSVRLQRFHIPKDAAVARWQFSMTKGTGFHCEQHNVTIHIRWGAPPVIDPVSSVFPDATLWSPAFSLSLPVTSHGSTTFSLSDPAPGDWYVAAHLPEGDRMFKQNVLPWERERSCKHFFWPQLSVRRAVDTPILQQATPLLQTAGPGSPARLKSFVPEFASSLSVSVDDCSWSDPEGKEPETTACPLVLSLGSASAEVGGTVAVNCSSAGCLATLSAPPWNTWIRVVVEKSVRDKRTVTFSVTSTYSAGCRQKSGGLAGDDDTSKLRPDSDSSRSSSSSSDGDLTSPSSGELNGELTLTPPSPGCARCVPVLSEELGALSLRYTPVGGPSISVARANPTLLAYPVGTHVTGGTLNLRLTLPAKDANALGNGSSVRACFTPWSPVLGLADSEHCRTALFPGRGVLRMSTGNPRAAFRLPFPQSATWYLSLQLACNGSDCGDASEVSVVPEVSVSACVDDCGVHGECRLLTSYTYLYAACACKAGWRGWGCTDGSSALSYGRQVTAVVLLVGSNLAFVLTAAVAAGRGHVAEASVYIFTAFFSAFYHACDQPGVAALCIMDYDTLQYCDFLGSVLTFCVTAISMARLPDAHKRIVFMLGALLIAMSLKLDRLGLWNMLGPILFASLTLASAWVYRVVRQRHCYPPSWKRWMFYLFPGLASALIGGCVFIFAETEDNYYITHSLWHVLAAISIVLLLPPGEKHRDSWVWAPGWRLSWRPQVCGYAFCQGSTDELYTSGSQRGCCGTLGCRDASPGVPQNTG